MIKVGDLITAYHAGYHIVTKIERRFYTEEDVKYGSYKSHKVGTEYNPLIYYETIADSFGKHKKHKERCCDSSFCNLVSMYELLQQKKDEIKAAEDKYNLLKKLYEEIYV